MECWFFSLYLWGTGGEGRGSEACFEFFPNPAKSQSEDFIRMHANLSKAGFRTKILKDQCQHCTDVFVYACADDGDYGEV